MNAKAWLAAVLAAMVCGIAPAADSPPSAPAEPSLLRWRKVYSPAERMSDWPRGSQRYVPVDLKEFERLASGANPAAEAERQGVALAEYRARLAGDGLVEGEARLRLAAYGELPANCSLEPCNLAIRDAMWTDDEPERAQLGLGADGKLAVVMQRPGHLQWHWTLRGKRDAFGSVEFSLDLPECPSSQLNLELPAGLTPLVDRAVAVAEGRSGQNHVRWCIELGGNHRVRMRVVPDEELAGDRRWNEVRQATTYEFSLRGVEVTSQLVLNAPYAAVRQIGVELDPGLRLVAARLGDAALTWSSTAAEGGKSRAVLSLPSPLQGSGRVVRLAAVAPIRLDRPWRLPAIRVDGMFWQEGTASLLIPAPLALQQSTVVEGRQTRTGPLAAPRSGESIDVQFYSPRGAVELTLAQPRAPLQIECATSLELNGIEMTGRVQSLLQVPDGERFQIEADVGRQWTIQSVESVPASALDDWNVQETQGGASKLTIRLAKAIVPSRPVKLIFSARHLHSPLGRTLRIDDLLPVRFSSKREARQIVALHAADSYQVAVTAGTSLPRKTLEDLTAEQRDLLGGTAASTILEVSADTAPLQVAIQPQKTAYAATIRVGATASYDRLTESFALAIVPESGRLDRFRVQIAPPRDAPLQWTLEGGNGEAIFARRLEHDDGCETWEVSLPQPRSEPFEVRALRSVPFKESLPVSLASLPEASSQQGHLSIGASGTRPLQVTNRRLVPAAAEPVDAGEYSTTQAVFRYDPARDAASAADEAVSIEPGVAQNRIGKAWVWSGELQSRYSPSGRTHHLAVYRVENHGEERLRLLLPPGLAADAVETVWVDSQRVSWKAVEESERAGFEVQLPAGRRFPLVAVDFVTEERPLGVVTSLESPMPEPDLPLLSRWWNVWLPPGYRANEQGTAASANWIQQFLGVPWLAGPAAGEAQNVPETSPHESDPWMPLAISHGGPSDAAGWTSCRLALPAEGSLRITAVREGSVRSLGWFALLAAFAITLWKGSQRRRLLAVLAGGTGAAAILLAAPWSGPCFGAMLGIVAGAVYRLWRPVAASAPASAETTAAYYPHSRSTSAFRSPPALMLLAVLASLAGSARAADAPPTEPAPVQNVFIPVDAEDKPVGDKCYVPEPLYLHLQRLAGVRRDPVQGWQLIGATYRGSLAWQTAPDELALTDLKIAYDLEVIGRQVQVRLPLAHDGARLLPDGAVLEGRVIRPDWADGAATLVFDVAEPGQYRLELSLAPVVQRTGGSSSLEMKIPRVPSARLELAIPADAPPIDVSSALGSVVREADPFRILAQLGPADRLRIRWPQSAPRGTGPAMDVEQLLWLHVNPGSVVLDTTLKFRVLGGHVRQFDLLADPRLQRLPLAAEQSLVAQVKDIPGRPQIVRFELAKAMGEAFTVHASFRLTECSGVGALRLPVLMVGDVPTRKRQLAVSVDPEMQYEQEGADRLQPVSASAFLAAWGGARVQPVLALELASPRPDWSLLVRPAASRTSAEQKLAVGFGQEQAQILFDADLETTSGAVFHYRIAAPENLEIERIAMPVLGVERVARWSREDGGAIHVFLNAPVTGKHTLSLRGRLPMPGRGKNSLPIVKLEGVDLKRWEIQLFRQPAVRVRIEKAENLTEIASPEIDASRAALGRLVKAYTAGPSPAASLALSANQAKLQVEQVTSLRQEGENWLAEVDFQIRPSGGIVDEFRLDAPPEWPGPYTVTPPTATVRIEQGKDSRSLVIRPAAAVEREYRLRIAGPLKAGADGRIRAQRVRLGSAEMNRHLLLLPEQRQGQPLAWDLRGLVRAEMPAGLPSASAQGEFAAYQVVADAFQAVLRSADRVQTGPMVLLADISIAWQDDRTCRGLASFFVQPGERSDCEVRLPPDHRLSQILRDGLPAESTLVGERRWKIALRPGRLPQRIDVLFTAELPAADVAGLQTLPAPVLPGLPVQQSIWTLCGPASQELQAGEAGGALSGIEHSLRRLRAIAAAIEAALESPGEETDEISRWHRTWSRTCSAACEEVKRQLAIIEGREEAAAAKSELEAIQERLAAAEKQLNKSSEPERQEAAPFAADPVELWLRTLARSDAVLHLSGWEPHESVDVVCRGPQCEGAWNRWLAAMGLVLAGCAAAWAVRRESVVGALARWPHAVGLIAGIAWSYFLPGVFGPLLVAASILGAAASLWHARRRR